MAGRVLPADAWLRGVLGLGAAHAAFLAIVWSRPGLVAVVLWYVAPILLGAAAAWLLGVALVRSWRHREAPGIQALVGYALLLLVMGTLATFRTFPSSYDDRPSRIPFRLPLDGPVTVAWGGSTRAENYHTVMPDQRWA
jgi:hypothetical protein